MSVLKVARALFWASVLLAANYAYFRNEQAAIASVTSGYLILVMSLVRYWTDEWWPTPP